VDVQVHDPIANAEEARREYGITLINEESLMPADAIVLAVPHDAYIADGWLLVSKLLKDRGGVVMDVKSKLDRSAMPAEVILWRL